MCAEALSSVATVTVKPLPTASLGTNNGPVCSGQTASFTLSGTSGATLTYTITGQAGSQMLALTGSPQTVTAPSATANVTLTLVSVSKDGCTQSLSGSATVTVNALPSLSLGSVPAICAGSTSFTVPYTASSQSPATYSVWGAGVTAATDAALPGSPIPVNLSGPASGSSIGFTLRVKNAAGCVSEAINGSVTVRPAIDLSTSGNTSVVYGYGSNCTTLTANASGGTGALSLTWSTGATGNSLQVCPTTTTTYPVTATDGAGCSVQKNITVTVNDVRCGNNTGVKMCYQGREVCVAPYLVPTYQRYGAALGGCGTGSARLEFEAQADKVSLQLSLGAYPNPVVDAVTVEVLAPKAGEATLDVLDVTGRTRQTQRQELSGGLNEVELRLGSLPTGLYLIRLRDAAGRQATVRVNKE